MIRLSRADAPPGGPSAPSSWTPAVDAPTGLVDVVQHLTFLQVDPTSAVAPAVDHVVWSRLGDAVWPGAVDDAITDHLLYQLVGSVRATADLPLHLAEMAAWPPDEHGHAQQWVDANGGLPARRARAAAGRGSGAVPRDPGHCRRAVALDRVDRQPETSR
jgi:hypothetical protein